MRWAALVAWLLTAAGGLVLFAAWLRHGGLRQAEGIRAGRLGSHLTLAVAGLLVWISYLAADRSVLAWTAVGLLGAVAAIGLSMFATSWRGRTREVHTAVVAEVSFPLPAVVAHGVLGATTLVVAALAAAGVG